MARRRRFDRRGATADGSAQALRRPTRDRSDADPLTRQDGALIALIALVTAVATAVRLIFPAVWSERDALGSVFDAGDVRAFTEFAAAIVSGQPFDNGVPFHPPAGRMCWRRSMRWPATIRQEAHRQTRRPSRRSSPS